MHIIPTSIFIISYLLIIYGCITNKLKLATTFGILILAFYPTVAGLVYLYAFPGIVSSGPIHPSIPLTIAFMTIITALTLWTPLEKNLPAISNEKPTLSRWLLILLGITFNWLGIALCFICWLKPHLLALNAPSPLLGIISYNIFTAINAVLFYLASNQNSEARPDLTRKIILLLIVFILGGTSWPVSMFLIYAFPIEPKIAYPTEAALGFLANLTWAVLLLAIYRKSLPIDLSTAEE